VTAQVTGGRLVITGTIHNIASFIYGSPSALQLAAILIVGTTQHTLDVDQTSGAISMPAGLTVQVTTGNLVTVRLQVGASFTTPRSDQLISRQDLEMEVSGGTSTTIWDTTNMPVPVWTGALSWVGGTGALQVVITFTSDGGATEDLLITSYERGGAASTSTAVDPSSTSQQTHTAAFDKAAAVAATGCAVEYTLASGATLPRQVLTWGIQNIDPNQIPAAGVVPAAGYNQSKNAANVAEIDAT